MTRLLAWLAGTLLLLVLAAGGLFLAAVDGEALVSRSATVSPAAIAQARWLLLTNDPRRMRAGDLRRTAIPVSLIDEGVNYLATRFLHGRAAFALVDDTAEIRLSLRLPALPVERFVNVSARLRQAEGEPHLAAARIGAFDIPPRLAEFALDGALALAGHGQEWRLARQAVRGLRFEPAWRHVVVAYAWEPSLLDRARNLAIDREDLARLRSAHEMLAGLLADVPRGQRIALPALLAPLLDVAGSDQAANRKAGLFVLAAYLSEKNLASLLPEAANWPRLAPTRPTLLGRHDSAQHFVISAALAAWAGEPLAEAIGLYKELADARHGSGFSFADLAADRAGTLFGEVLKQHPERLDAWLRGPLAESELLPSLAELPENLRGGELQRRFGAPGSPAYRELIAEIDRRVYALAIYRGLEKT